jgi:hypothetical protein
MCLAGSRARSHDGYRGHEDAADDGDAENG